MRPFSEFSIAEPDAYSELDKHHQRILGYMNFLYLSQ